MLAVVRLLLAVVSFSIGGTLPLLAQDAAPSPAPGEAVSSIRLPVGFKQTVPASVNELREMQDHITSLVPQLMACTVNLRIGRSQGSGVIVSSEGIVLSAAHVTGPPGKQVIVVTADGKRFDGVSLGRNRTLDAGMVQIQSDRTDWPHCQLSSRKMVPGAWCIALGHPGGFQRERGLVLRLGRVIERNDWLIRTDCELVGGDSGGPLFNMQGEVIGINTRIGEHTDYNFHVPGATFVRDWNRLVAGEEFKSHSGAYLGLTGIPADSGKGLLIQTVEPGAPADREGLQPGDILLNFQEHPVTKLEELIDLVGEEFPGQTVELLVLRNGKEETFHVRLGMQRD